MFAKTVDELKQDLIDHLASIDLEKLNMIDLSTYAMTVKTADDMMRRDAFERFFENTNHLTNGFKYCACEKEGVADG